MRAPVAKASSDEDPPFIDQDIRDFRARLVAREKAGEGDPEGGAEAGQQQQGWAYETPLIEKGSVLLGGTKQVFGFGLRQQYFHKCVLLLVQHDASFTKGIILNRPTSLKLDGWDIWFGGDVQEGGMFRGQQLRDPAGMRDLPPEILCLHQLDNPDVLEASSNVIKDIHSLPFEAAQGLVAAGKAKKSDFWTFVGYCGWGRGQLQSELERDSWYMAAADSSLLLQELLALASDPASLPRAAEDGSGALAPGGDGIGTWETLMRNIGRVEEVELPEESARSWAFEDGMLREWVRQKLTDRGSVWTASAAAAVSQMEELEVGTLLLRAPPGDSPEGILEKQFLHKSVLLVVERTPDLCLAVILNRPTSSGGLVALDPASDGVSIRIRFGGEAAVRGSEGYICLMPTEDAPLGAQALGRSGVSRVGSETPSSEHLSSLQVVRGFCFWEGRGLEQEVAEGRFVAVAPGVVPWDELWALGSEQGAGGGEAGWTPSSIGMTIWQEAWDNHWHGDEEEGPGDGPRQAFDIGSLSLADLALLEWAKWFAK